MKSLLLVAAVLGLCACESKATGPDPKETERLVAYYMDHLQERREKARECEVLAPEQANQRSDCLAVPIAMDRAMMKNYATPAKHYEYEPAKKPAGTSN